MQVNKGKLYTDKQYIELLKIRIKELEEENKILKELNVCVGCDNNTDYKKRIDKAIEYIEDKWYEKNTTDIYSVVSTGDIRIDILKILNGEE